MRIPLRGSVKAPLMPHFASFGCQRIELRVVRCRHRRRCDRVQNWFGHDLAGDFVIGSATERVGESQVPIDCIQTSCGAQTSTATRQFSTIAVRSNSATDGRSRPNQTAITCNESATMGSDANPALAESGPCHDFR